MPGKMHTDQLNVFRKKQRWSRPHMESFPIYVFLDIVLNVQMKVLL